MKFKYDENYIKDNIRESCEGLSYSFIEENKYWFNQAHFYCKDFSEKIGVPFMPVVGTLSALSVQTSWKQNKIFLEAYYKNFNKHTRTTIDKCNRINAMFGYLVDDYELQKKQILSYLGGRKTQSFFDNILNPNTSQRVTIDRHMLCIAGFDNMSITIKQYNFLENCYKDIASEEKLIPSQLQSILWMQRRINLEINNKFD